MKWVKDHQLPNTESTSPDTLPTVTTSSPNLIKKEEQECESDSKIINGCIKEESSNEKIFSKI